MAETGVSAIRNNRFRRRFQYHFSAAYGDINQKVTCQELLGRDHHKMRVCKPLSFRVKRSERFFFSLTEFRFSAETKKNREKRFGSRS